MTYSPQPVAAGAPAVEVAHVARVGVAHAVVHRDPTRPGEGRGWRGSAVEHPVVGVEGGEVHRHVGAEVLDHPPGHGVEFLVAVVHPGDQQRGELDPHIGLGQVLERVEDRAEFGTAGVLVEVLGESLQVDVGGVEVAVELARVVRARCTRR